MLAICDMYHSFLLVSVVFFLSCNLCLTDSFYLFSMKWNCDCLVYCDLITYMQMKQLPEQEKIGRDLILSPPKK